MDTLPSRHDQPDADERRARTIGVRVGLTLLFVVFGTFWIWALFFASKESANKIDDRAWAERAQQICLEATEERLEFADLRVIADGGPELIRERADTIVEPTTDVLVRMIDEVVAVAPTDSKGREIVPLWEADYRIYLQDRYDYADQLRESGENLPFYESADTGIPISERIESFAVDNEMPACAPPRDLTG